jgi:hypothetical protein
MFMWIYKSMPIFLALQLENGNAGRRSGRAMDMQLSVRRDLCPVNIFLMEQMKSP